MGQIFSNLWRWLNPNSRNKTQNDYYQRNYQTFSYDDKQLESHLINISDEFQPIKNQTNRNYLDDSSTPCNNRYEEVDEEKKEALLSIDYGEEIVIEEAVLEKYVTSTTINHVIISDNVREIGPYKSTQKLLLVGEGDFSFSACLAAAFGSSALNITATSLDSQDFLIKNYSKFMKNKTELETRGSLVLHGVDATKMVNHPILGSSLFDIIIFNFPHSGKFGKTESKLRKHQELVRGFIKNAKKMIREDGEIHITSKSNRFYMEWDIPKLGSDQGLHLVEAVRFKRSKYPGYQTKFGFGGDKYFHCNPSKTYKFSLNKS